MALRKKLKKKHLREKFICAQATRRLTLPPLLSNRLASCCSSDIADIPESEYETVCVFGDGDLPKFISGCLENDFISV